MGGVLGAIASDNLVDAIVATQREVNLNDVVAWLHQSQDALHLLALLVDIRSLLHVLNQRVFHNLTAAVEKVFDLNLGEILRKIDKIESFKSRELVPCRRIWGFELLGCAEGVLEFGGPTCSGSAGCLESAVLWPAPLATSPSEIC